MVQGRGFARGNINVESHQENAPAVTLTEVQRHILVIQGRGKTKVSKLHALRICIRVDIVWFDIKMCHAALMHMLKCAGNLHKRQKCCGRSADTAGCGKPYHLRNFICWLLLRKVGQGECRDLASFAVPADHRIGTFACSADTARHLHGNLIICGTKHYGMACRPMPFESETRQRSEIAAETSCRNNATAGVAVMLQVLAHGRLRQGDCLCSARLHISKLSGLTWRRIFSRSPSRNESPSVSLDPKLISQRSIWMNRCSP